MVGNKGKMEDTDFRGGHEQKFGINSLILDILLCLNMLGWARNIFILHYLFDMYMKL
jgi:hypothetical protein